MKSTSTNQYIAIELNKNTIYLILEQIVRSLIVIKPSYKAIIVISIPTIIYALYKHPKNTIIGICGVFWQIIMFLFINIGCAPQKTNTIFLVIVFVSWISIEQIKNSEMIKHSLINIVEYYFIYLAIIFLIISDFSGLQSLRKDIKYQYSGSLDTAVYINNNIEKDSIFVCTNIVRACAIIPYVHNMTFINPLDFNEFTYITWDEYAYEKIEIGEVIDRTIKMNKSEKNVYLIESIYSNEENEIIKKYQNNNILSKALYTSDLGKNIGDESFRIYKINR